MVAWAFARFMPGRIFWPIGLLFGGWGVTLILLALAITAAAIARWDVAIFLGLASIGITSIVELPMWLWATSKKLNPKYAIAKRMFGMTFPFESILTRQDREPRNDLEKA
jgi:hypothetical protein